MKALEKLRDSILLFGKVVMPRTFYLPSPEFHHEIAQVLEDKNKRYINIIAPRGSAKSSLIAGVYVLHHILFAPGQKLVLLTSRTQYHAILLLQTIKDILEYSEAFRGLFGYWGQQSAKKWTSTEITLKDGSAIICKGTGQQVRGLKVGNQRPTLIIIDDPEDENNTKTSEAMESNLRWLLQSVVPSIDSHKGRIVIIGTPLHERCMVMLIKEASGWMTLHYKYLNTNSDGKVVSLWPEMKSVETLESIKKDHDEMGRLSIFYKEYQCEVIGNEDQLFKEKYLNYYDGEYADGAITMKDGKKIPVFTFMGVDPASSTKETADYSAVVTIAVDKDNNRYILPYIRKRVTPMHLADIIIAQYHKYKPERTRIETVGYQEMLREYLRAEADEKGIYISGLEIKENPRNSKSSRLESMQPIFARGKVFLLRDQREMIDELLLYPRGKHDDLLDGLFYAMKNIYLPDEGKVYLNTNASEYREPLSWLVV